MVSQLRSCGVRLGMRVNLKGTAIALVMATISAPLMMSAGQAQQALPPPPSVPNSNELPSLAPVAAPPSQGILMPPPAGLPTLPQESVYQATPPLPGTVPGMGISPSGAMPELRASYYQVVVPTRTEDFATIANKMMAMGVRADAIQARKAPIGPHLAVGPFVNLGEAEGVSSYLRAGGMDARVFFNR